MKRYPTEWQIAAAIIDGLALVCCALPALVCFFLGCCAFYLATAAAAGFKKARDITAMNPSGPHE